MTNWQADRERYERENPGWKITESEADAFKRLEAKNVKEWRELALRESREEFYARILPRLGRVSIPIKRPLAGFKTAAKYFSGEPRTIKKGATKEVITLRARVSELESMVAKLMGEINGK